MDFILPVNYLTNVPYIHGQGLTVISCRAACSLSVNFLKVSKSPAQIKHLNLEALIQKSFEKFLARQIRASTALQRLVKL